MYNRTTFMPFKCNMFKQCWIIFMSMQTVCNINGFSGNGTCSCNAKTVLVEMELFVPTSMNVQQDNIHAIQMQHVQTSMMLDHIHVNAKSVLVEMELFVQTSMNVQQDNIHAIQMQHVQTMLDHIHVNAKSV